MAVWYPSPSMVNSQGLARLVMNAQIESGCMIGQTNEAVFFRDLYEQSDSHYQAGELLKDLLKTLLPAPSNDPRLLSVIAQIEAAPQQQVSVSSWARSIDVSPSRFMHLFSEHLGIPYRTYRTWCRLRHSMRLASQGLALTEAALESGFSDSQHFSREFRQKLGVAPSGFLRQVGRVV